MATGTDSRIERAEGSPNEAARRARERLVAALLDAVRGPAGCAPLAARDLALALAHASATGSLPPRSDSLHSDARMLVDAVAARAHDVPDELVVRALASGLNEHEAFDLIVTAAVGAGLSRREIGLEAIADCLASSALGGGLP